MYKIAKYLPKCIIYQIQTAPKGTARANGPPENGIAVPFGENAFHARGVRGKQKAPAWV
jgi:hypothetical protein